MFKDYKTLVMFVCLKFQFCKGKNRKKNLTKFQFCIDEPNTCQTKLTFATDIILVVRVPVLSLQITVVQPKVSTDGKERTMAFNLAIRFVPRAKHLKWKKSKQYIMENIKTQEHIIFSFHWISYQKVIQR